jgi:hypothetical protein
MKAMDFLLAGVLVVALWCIIRALLIAARIMLLHLAAAVVTLLAVFTGLIARVLQPRNPSPRSAE